MHLCRKDLIVSSSKPRSHTTWFRFFKVPIVPFRRALPNTNSHSTPRVEPCMWPARWRAVESPISQGSQPKSWSGILFSLLFKLWLCKCRRDGGSGNCSSCLGSSCNTTKPVSRVFFNVTFLNGHLTLHTVGSIGITFLSCMHVVHSVGFKIMVVLGRHTLLEITFLSCPPRVRESWWIFKVDEPNSVAYLDWTPIC